MIVQRPDHGHQAVTPMRPQYRVYQPTKFGFKFFVRGKRVGGFPQGFDAAGSEGLAGNGLHDHFSRGLGWEFGIEFGGRFGGDPLEKSQQFGGVQARGQHLRQPTSPSRMAAATGKARLY